MAFTVARRCGWLSLCVIVVAVACQHAHAVSSQQGLTVSPAIEQINLLQNQDSASFTLDITNHSSQPVLLAASARDFTTFNQSGGIRFLSGQEAPGAHTLAGFMVIATPQIRVAAGETAHVTIAIQHANKLAAGGHYAAVVLQTLAGKQAGSNIVTTSPAVSSLVFVTTYGKGTQNIQLAAPRLGHFLKHMPDALDLVFANTGNTQATLRGVAQITDVSGQALSQGIINVDSGLILPGSQRLFHVALQAQSRGPQLVGSYTLHVLYRYDGQADYTLYEATFLYVNAVALWIGAAVILGAAASLIYVIRRHSHHRVRQ